MTKKITLLLALLATLAFSAASASAAEIKASGTWQVEADWINNSDFKKANDEKSFDVQQRMRTAFQFIANENLKGVFETQIGTNSWGNGVYQIGAGRSGNGTVAGANSAGNGNIMLRRGYIDFKWPGTKIATTVGFQTVALPHAIGGGSPIVDDQMGAAVVSAPITDNVAILAGYARPFDNWGNTSTGNGTATHGSSADMVFAAVPLTFSGFNVTPFAAYANIGHAVASTTVNNVSYNVGGMATPGLYAPGMDSAAEGIRAYWAGAAFTMTALDPFKFMADFDYGNASWRQAGAADDNGKRAGYLFDIAADYTGLKFMTPELFFAYSSGEDSSSNGKSERMPVVGNPQNYALGNFWLDGGDSLNASYYTPSTTLGYWALGLSFKDIKFIDKLSHSVNFIYFKGTNNKQSLAAYNSDEMPYGQYLTTKDSMFEIDVNSKYQVYDQLALMLELGYINAHFDKDLWASALNEDSGHLSKDAYKASLMVQYSF